MSKGEFTRENIIERAAVLFNSQGYAGVSISELMKKTGLKKGGIYNHFNSKEEILIAAFEYSIRILRDKVLSAILEKQTAAEQLKGIIDFYRDYPMNPVIKGGCPVLNSIIYSDNTKLNFKKSVRNAVDDLLNTLILIIEAGIKNKEFKKSVTPEKTAVIIFTAIEGGVAISRNYKDNKYMNIMMDHLINYIEKELLK